MYTVFIYHRRAIKEISEITGKSIKELTKMFNEAQTTGDLCIFEMEGEPPAAVYEKALDSASVVRDKSGVYKERQCRLCARYLEDSSITGLPTCVIHGSVIDIEREREKISNERRARLMERKCEGSESPIPCEGGVRYMLNPYDQHVPETKTHVWLCEMHQFGWPPSLPDERAEEKV